MRFVEAVAWGSAWLLMACSPQVREARPASAYSEPTVVAEPESKPTPPEQASPPAADVPASTTERSALPAVEVGPRAHFVRTLPTLNAFYSKLDALLAGGQEMPVRVLWWGDSHTAADFLTDPVREHLQEQVGDGGAGFFRLGLKGYRHGKVRLAMSGRWRKAPILPAQRTRVLDGVFGLGGIRTLPAAGASASASLRDPDSAPYLWSLSYRLPPGAQLEVELGGETHRLRSTEESESEIQISSWEADGDARLQVRHVAGDPQIMGAYVERLQAGAVLDTIGINGARLATVLAWEPTQLKQQLKWRRPDLLILAFGTNEVFDNTRVSSYLDHFERVISLAREAVPELPCWVVGPPDSATNSGGSKERVLQVTEIQREAAQLNGCAFTSQFELMGGEGSFTAWTKRRPAWARTDRIHLSIAGYEELGRRVAEALLQSLEEEPSEPIPDDTQ